MSAASAWILTCVSVCLLFTGEDEKIIDFKYFGALQMFMFVSFIINDNSLGFLLDERDVHKFVET